MYSSFTSNSAAEDTCIPYITLIQPYVLQLHLEQRRRRGHLYTLYNPHTPLCTPASPRTAPTRTRTARSTAPTAAWRRRPWPCTSCAEAPTRTGTAESCVDVAAVDIPVLTLHCSPPSLPPSPPLSPPPPSLVLLRPPIYLSTTNSSSSSSSSSSGGRDDGGRSPLNKARTPTSMGASKRARPKVRELVSRIPRCCSDAVL
jgi:hypothetical protein